MYIIKNSFKNIARNPGRNLLIGIIVLAIAISSCIALTIKKSAKTAEEEGLSKLTVTANISVDRQALMTQAQKEGGDMREFMQKYSSLTLDELKKYADSQYVKDFYYTLSSSVSKSDGFVPVDTSTATNESDKTTSNNTVTSKGEMPFRGENGQHGFAGMGNQGDFSLTGFSDENAMTSFINGTNKVTQGSLFSFTSSDLSCIISEQLATFNSLSVGDTIKITNPNLDTETYSFKITGIYSSTESTSDNGMMRFSTSNDPANKIYTSYNNLKTIETTSQANATTGEDEQGNQTTTALRMQEHGTYSFADVTSFEHFKTDTKAMGLSEYYTVESTDVINYEQSLVPLKNISKFADMLLLLVLSIGGVILVVLNIFNIRERKYEVGVLTAIGMKKGKVALQFVIELFIVTFIAIIVGTSIGAITSVPTANMMLKEQIASQQTQQQTQEQNFGRPSGGMGNQQGGMGIQQGGMGNRFQGMNSFRNPVEYVNSIQAVTDITVILQLIGIGLALTLLSSCIAVVFILRYEPLKILSNRA